MATLAELESALVGADKAGDMDAARKLAAAIVVARRTPSNLIPTTAGANTTPAAPQAPSVGAMPIPGTGVTVGNAEAALQLGTGMVGGALGMAGGAIGGLAGSVLNGDFGTPAAADRIEQGMAEGAQALTYQPRTPEGQEQGQAAGAALANLIPIMPLGAEMAGAARGAAAAAPAAQATAAGVSASAKAVAADAAGAMSTVTGKVRAALGKTPETAGGSVGAAGTEVARMRQERALSLPVPIKLTKGMATRDFEQTRFERETAKEPVAGLVIRERVADINERVLKNFDAFVDMTGAEAPSLRATGAAVDRALVQQFQADKTKVRAAYKAAEKAGEMEQPVTLASVVDHLNESAPDAATAPILDVARKRAIRLGVAAEGPDGTLIAQTVPLKTAETMRQAVQRATDYEPTNVRQATIIKGLIDETTDGLGGGLYRAARKERQRLAQNYENRAVVNKLVSLKRGTQDRQVALEDVFSHAILDGALDDVRNVRRVLQRSGRDGEQAWRELQGQTVQYLKAEATKNSARDVRGNEVVSAAGLDRAVKKLDADGKLDFVFGKKGAQTVRDLNDLAKDVYTVPAGSVNTSNTASVLSAALDMAISGSAGLPLPVMSGMRLLLREVKDRRLANRVRESLGPVAPPAPPPRQTAPAF